MTGQKILTMIDNSYEQPAMPQTAIDFMIQDFGLEAYETVWATQTRLVDERLADTSGDMLLVGEHLPVITQGRNTHAENLLTPSIPVISIERGGDVTYHGPGQLIAYPIFLLPPERRDLHRFLRDLEEVIILTIAEFGLVGIRNPGWTGVWVEDKVTGELLKLASIGVAVRKWVTYHGLALNVMPELSHFAQINPCGLQSQVMTSMQAQLNQPVSINAVKESLKRQFRHVFA